MSTRLSASQFDVETLKTNFREDPRREPHEKETAIHINGDDTHYSITSFKRVVFLRLLQRPDFSVSHIPVHTDEGRESTVESVDEVLADSSLTGIGVVGQLPVGTLLIGNGRKSNSHSQIVK